MSTKAVCEQLINEDEYFMNQKRPKLSSRTVFLTVLAVVGFSMAIYGFSSREVQTTTFLQTDNQMSAVSIEQVDNMAETAEKLSGKMNDLLDKQLAKYNRTGKWAEKLDAITDKMVVQTKKLDTVTSKLAHENQPLVSTSSQLMEKIQNSQAKLEKLTNKMVEASEKLQNMTHKMDTAFDSKLEAVAAISTNQLTDIETNIEKFQKISQQLKKAQQQYKNVTAIISELKGAKAEVSLQTRFQNLTKAAKTLKEMAQQAMQIQLQVVQIQNLTQQLQDPDTKPKDKIQIASQLQEQMAALQSEISEMQTDVEELKQAPEAKILLKMAMKAQNQLKTLQPIIQQYLQPQEAPVSLHQQEVEEEEEEEVSEEDLKFIADMEELEAYLNQEGLISSQWLKEKMHNSTQWAKTRFLAPQQQVMTPIDIVDLIPEAVVSDELQLLALFEQEEELEEEVEELEELAELSEEDIEFLNALGNIKLD